MLIDVSAEEIHPADLFSAQIVHERKLTVTEKRFVLEIQKFLSRALPDEAIDAIDKLSLKFTGEFQQSPNLHYSMILQPEGITAPRVASNVLTGQRFDVYDDDTMLGIAAGLVNGIANGMSTDMNHRASQDRIYGPFGGRFRSRLLPGVDLQSFLDT